MIPNQWYAILESNEVKRGTPIGVTRFGEKLVAWRNERGEVALLRDRCSHRGAALSAGRMVGDCVECPFHGFLFDATGRCCMIPANGKTASVPKVFNMPAYPTREAHHFIWAWTGEASPDLPPIPFFEDIDSSFSYFTYRDHWPVHYTRAIENQLDVVHLPFVHKTTIGRGNATLVDGPRVTLEKDCLTIWVDNRVDDGAPPRKHTEMLPSERRPLLTFLFPNIWQNRLSDDLRIVLAFVPVDGENCVLYLRQYQRIVRAPLIRDIFNNLAKLGNIVILNQDKRVVITQRPVQTDAGMDEHLIQGDRPIILYRARRKQLQAAAADTNNRRQA
jgi:phenylpropionate dioxygenase-like ring-hydroxylating dioxygenase large terminal subunit